MQKYNYNKNKEKGMYLFFGIAGLVCFLLSGSFVPFLLGEKGLCMPDLVLCLCCVVPIYTSRTFYCIYAVCLGFLQDLFITSPQHLSPVVFLCCTLLVPYFLKPFKNVGNVTLAVCSLPCLAIRGIVGLLSMTAKYQDAKIMQVLVKITLPELLINFAFTLVVGFVCSALIKILRLAKK